MLPYDCLNLIVSFSDSKTIEIFAFCSHHFYNRIKHIHFWMDKSKQVKFPMFIQDYHIDEDIYYWPAIKLTQWIKLYDKSLQSYKNAHHTLVMQKVESALIQIRLNRVMVWPTGCEYAVRWTHLAIINKNKIYFQYGNGSSTHDQNDDQLLYVLSYFYSIDAQITDVNGHSFISNHNAIRRVVWKTADQLGHIKK